uniref:Mannuronate C5-epimerase n=1 Tax=Saccharina japonica TaxID=88149 RepID=A0A7L4XTJ3_SACJA|nr:Mannuronate C5-epimerase [Saccharina japonica]
MAGKALSALAATLSLCAVNACGDHHCWGVNICTGDDVCGPPSDCDASSITVEDDVIQIRGSRCRVTMEAIHLALPDAVTKDGTEYTLNNKLVVRDGCILEIHGASKASSPDAVVTLLKLKSDETSYAPIIAMAGQISILDTAITSYDESKGGSDERLEGRAYIAALSLEDETTGEAWISRMDVEDSEISYLGNEGDYHNDINNDYGLVWKVEGYDDRFPGDLSLFSRVGVYGTLKRNKIHDMFIGAYCYGMKGNTLWTGNEIYDNYLNGMNPQDNSDGMTISDNHVHDNGWHGIEYSKRCKGALVFDNLVEDNARAGIFFHRSTDYAEAYGNTCRRNLEGDFGIVESTGVTVHDNVMEGGKYGIRLSLGAQECDVYDNVMSDNFRYGVFFYRGSDEAEASADWDGRPRLNYIRNNKISDPVEGKGVAVTGSDDNFIIDNEFIGIDSLRFDDAQNTLVTGNILPDGVEFTLDDGATLADGSQSDTD